MLKIRNLLFLLILFTFSCKDNLHTVVKGKVFLRADGSLLDSIEVGVYRTTGGPWSSTAASSSLVKKVVTDSDGYYSISFDAEEFTNSGGGKYVLYPYRYDAAKNKY